VKMPRRMALREKRLCLGSEGPLDFATLAQEAAVCLAVSCGYRMGHGAERGKKGWREIEEKGRASGNTRIRRRMDELSWRASRRVFCHHCVGLSGLGDQMNAARRDMGLGSRRYTCD
jgi:hypothetical protein